MPQPPHLATLAIALGLATALALPPGTAGAACDRNLLLQPMVQFGLGNFPVVPAVADFDGDGFLDVAVSNYLDNTVSVLRGAAGGTFAPPVDLLVGSGPRDIAIGDFDGDGRLDLAVSLITGGGVQILHGNGNGTFTAGAIFPTGASENRGLVATDLNGDGVLDLVVAGRNDVAVLIGHGAAGHGDGTFAAPLDYPTHSSWGVTVGDMNGDGIPDIAAGNWLTGSVVILLGNGSGGVGNGTFHAAVPVVTPGGCASITCADLNGDGKLDLVAAGSTGEWVMLGKGDGTFTVTPYFTDGQENFSAIADLDGDGHLDIAATDTGADGLLVFFGDGTGAFPAQLALPTGNGPNGIVAADVTREGLTDLLVVNSGASTPGSLGLFVAQCTQPAAPAITGVRDVPHDQGGKVFVTWTRSRLDDVIHVAITGYRVWRRIMPPGTGARVANGFAAFDPHRDAVVAQAQGSAITYWEPLAEIPAAFLEGYGYTAATTQDSIAGSNPYTAFFVQALTYDPTVFFSSTPDSGYSVDNLAPPAPTPFVAQYSASGAALHWTPSRAPDFLQFRLYRGFSADFTPGPANLIAAQTDTGFVDSGSVPNAYYKLAALDVHGNVSRYALVSPASPTAALATMVTATVGAGRASLTWYVSADDVVGCAVQRRGAGADWQVVETTLPDGAGYVRIDDTGLAAGTRYDYRLALTASSGAVTLAGDASIVTPSAVVDLAPRVVNPVVGGEVTLSFAFPAGRTTRVELLDVTGRVVASRDVVGTGARTSVALASARALAPGVYLVRVAADRVLTLRVAVIR